MVVLEACKIFFPNLVQCFFYIFILELFELHSLVYNLLLNLLGAKGISCYGYYIINIID